MSASHDMAIKTSSAKYRRRARQLQPCFARTFSLPSVRGERSRFLRNVGNTLWAKRRHISNHCSYT